jgi:uncharacterized protein DUF1573
MVAATILTLLALQSAASGGPRCVIDETQHVFGKVKQGDRVVHAFTIRNTGDVPLKLKGSRISAAGLTTKSRPEIAPGTQGDITLELATERMAGDVEAEFALDTNDPQRPRLVLALRGEVVPPVSLLPIPAVFLSGFVGEATEQTLTVQSNEERPLAVTSLQPEGTHFTAALRAERPGKTFRIAVRVVPGTPPGRYEESLLISTDHPAYGAVKVPVHLFVKPDIYVSPDSVELGELRAGELAAKPERADLTSQTLLVKARAKSLALTEVSIDVPGLSVTKEPAGKSDTFQLSVRVAPRGLARGPISGKIVIRTDDPRFPQIVVPVTGNVVD